MKLYNTLSRQTEEFRPITEGKIKLYTCGPTVYDYAHLGNLRAFVFDDLLRRVLQDGYEVKHVMNITDVGHLASDQDEGDDKLEKGAARENKSVWELADFYITAFEADMHKLGVLPPNGYHGPKGVYARATDFIDEQIELVKILLNKDFAYQTEQAIYFDVSKLPDYGKLTGQKLADKEVAARPEVVTDEHKQNPQDFALWFFKTGRFAGHSMSWSSPWGDGFPGWHLECSAIIHATLGEPIDVHTGGVDHIGTHHTNEIAQTEAAYGIKLANFWLHNEHLLVDGQKMSKSAGNFFTLGDIIKKGYNPLALRLLFLQAHYRSQMNFTWEALDAAQSFLKRIQAWADLKFQPAFAKDGGQSYKEAVGQIKTGLRDDLNSAAALAVISQLASASEEDGIDNSEIQGLLERIDNLLGLDLAGRQDIDEATKKLIQDREQARVSKNWEQSDQLRVQLAKAGIELSDTPNGPAWRRL